MILRYSVATVFQQGAIYSKKSAQNFTSVAHFCPFFRKCAFLCRKMQNFCVVFSRVYEKCDKKVKIFRKIGLTFGVDSGKILGTPTRCSSKG